MLILLAEDDPKLAKMLIRLLNKDGYQLDHAFDGEEALLYYESNTYDLIILDWMMPRLNGIDTCVKLRDMNYMGAILILTAKDTLDHKVVGLESGADDYLVKPFEYRELAARIKALLRRSSKTIEKDILVRDEIILDRSSKTVCIKNQEINLSKREYQLFSVLFENEGQVIPRETLINLVWGIDSDITNNNLDAYISLLRKKVEKNDKKIIKSVRGIGYKMVINDV